VDAPLREAAARYVLGLLPSDALPAAAADLVASGWDSAHLRLAAAGTEPSYPSEVREHFERALEELGALPLDKLTAARFLVPRIAADVAARRIAPRDGSTAIVERIWFGALDYTDPFRGTEDVRSLQRLVDLHYEHGLVTTDLRAAGRTLDDAIREACLELAGADAETD